MKNNAQVGVINYDNNSQWHFGPGELKVSFVSPDTVDIHLENVL